MSTQVGGFRRDGTTLLAYAALATYTFCLYALGPMLTYLREELQLSYTLTSLHSALWAGGTVVTGLAFARLVSLIGRRRLFWLSGGGIGVGLVILILGHDVVLTLLGAAWLGTFGTVLQTGCISLLSQRHGERRDRALVEATIGGSLAAVLAPLVLGAAERTEAGWRAGLVLPLLALAAIYALFRRLDLPTGTPIRQDTRGRLHAGFWILAVLVAAVVGLEFCLVFYAPQLLRSGAGIPTSLAATALTLFYLGELAGRAAGGTLTRRPGRAGILTAGGLTLALAGVLPIWLSGRAWLAIPGLLVAGLGVANLYPLTLALALGAAGGQTDVASARIQLLVGGAVLGAPLALGFLADRLGVEEAFALVPALVALALLLLVTSKARQPA